MTWLLACVRDRDEAISVLAAGFDGVVGRWPGSGAGVVGFIGTIAPDENGPALKLVHLDGRHRSLGLVDAAALPGGGDAGGRDGVLLTAQGRLLDTLSMPRLAAAVAAWRSAGAVVALAGGLEAPDVPRLLPLRPDLLLFGRALRTEGVPAAALDPARLAAIRALVPRGDQPVTPATVVAARPDRIFVHDLVLTLDIGAYLSEHGQQQRVRFSVDAMLEPATRPAQAMADVVSYDLIADAIARVAAAARAEFLEPMAEAVAADLLGHARIAEVVVRIEKLDRGPGAVGIEIARRR